jgi:hypothetical protein
VTRRVGQALRTHRTRLVTTSIDSVASGSPHRVQRTENSLDSERFKPGPKLVTSQLGDIVVLDPFERLDIR